MINIQRILCPVDLSPVSVTAVDYATSLAKSYGAAVYLLHVVSPIVPGFEYAVDIREVAQSLKERSTEEMGKLVAKLEDTSVIAGVEVRVGNVYDEIKTAIETVGPDIVLMGTHRRGGVERLFRGSTVEKLLRHSPAPIVTVPPEVRRHSPTSSFRRILVATDFSEGTDEAMAYGLSLAQENQSRVTLLHVINDPAVDLSAAYRVQVIGTIQKQLEDMVPAETRNWCEVVTRFETGTPYRNILRTLETDEVDLVVMNIHSKGLFARALIGSTAERVVRAATCPVMLIPPMKGQAKKTTPRIEERVAA